MTPVKRPVRVVAAVGMIVATLGFALLSAQEPTQTPPVFRGGTTLVPLDIRVLDRDGRPVTDLTEKDFTVRENGVTQRIGHFSAQAFSPQLPTAGPTRPRMTTDALEFGTPNQRTFLIVFGRGRLLEPAKGVDAMLHFVRERLLPQDLVAVAAWNRATDLTTDHEQIAKFIERFKARHYKVEADLRLWETSLARVYGDGTMPKGIQRDVDDIFGGARGGMRSLETNAPDLARIDEQTRRAADRVLGGSLADPVDQAEIDRSGGTLDGFLGATTQAMEDLGLLYRSVDYLRHLAGEKQLIFVSEHGLSLPRVEDDRSITRAAADSRVVLNFIHTGGVPFGGPDLMTGSRVGYIQAGQTARSLTRETGGQFFGGQFRTAAADADRFDQASRFQYLLGYYPANAVWDGKYRKITVSVSRPGLTVLYRDGFFARREIAPLDRKGMMVFGRVVSAVGHGKAIGDLQVTVTRADARRNGPQRGVEVDLKIDLSRVSFEKRGTRNEGSVEVAIFGIGPSGQDAGHSWQTLKLNYTDERLAQVRTSGLLHQVAVPLTGPAKEIRIVVYDYGADLVGTIIKSVTVR